MPYRDSLVKKLGTFIFLLSAGSFALVRFGLRALPDLAEYLSEPNHFGLVSALQGCGMVLGACLFGLPLLMRKTSLMFAVVGVVLALPVGVFMHGWGVNRTMPSAILRLNSRWDGSYLHHYSPEFLDQGSAWIMELNPKREAYRAVNLHMAMGGYLQRMGRVPEAILHLERANEIVHMDGSKAAERTAEVARALGVAYLRSGEIASCLLRPNEQSCIFPLEGTGLWRDPADAVKAEILLREALELEPGDAGIRWLLALSQEVAGTYPTDLHDHVLLPERTMKGETTAPHFRNLAVALGVAGDDLAGSVALDDFDNDGHMDIVTCSYNPNEPLRYYHNNGDGSFSDWTERAGLIGQTGGLNLTHADFDNDGLLDILVLRGAWFLSSGVQTNSLLRQNADHTFTDVTQEAGLALVDYPSLAATWGDFDLDGLLDVYIGNERMVAMGRGTGSDASEAKSGGDELGDHAPSQLFHNNGDGTFTDVAVEAGVTNHRFARGTAFGDYDNDGYPDLVVSNLSQANRLYHNNGNGTFTDIAESESHSFLQRPTRAFGSWWMDVNNDGNLDLFVSGYPLTDKVTDVISDRYGEARGKKVDPLALYLGDGQGGFTDVTKEWNLDRVHLTMGANIGDVDSDGWMDIYLGTGAPSLEIMVPNVLLRNMGGEQFMDATTASGLGHLHKGHGIAMSDMDNDGDLDIYAQLGGWYVDSHSQNAMFINEGTPNHSVTLQLEGKSANRFGLGAKLKLTVMDGGTRREIHLIAGGTGSFGSNPMEQHVGVGQATEILELEVIWPVLGGGAQVLRNLPVGKTLRIVQNEENWVIAEQSVSKILPD
ncbi:MAG: FG-GAP-like repeat-containing protein [Planctomycetota bacterium]|nr:FG-GAP-like repeat-containing protein [Planctomycetota bacterium]